MIYCKVCGQEAKTRRGLHLHLSRAHEMPPKRYYETHEPRENLLTGRKIKFNPKKGYKEYFEKDFATKDQLNQWCRESSEEVVRPYILSLLKKYAAKRKTKLGPCKIDFMTSKTLPDLEVFDSIMGYDEALRACDLSPMFDYSSDPKKLIINQTPIFVDTREKAPFKFRDGSPVETHKLDIGDYCLSGKHFNKIFVERKGEDDFKATLSNQIERFEREINRCKNLGCYMFIVVEKKIPRIIKDNFFGGFNYNLDWIFHNMRRIQREYKDHCQFVFSENKREAAKTTQYLLQNGPSIKGYDVNFTYNF